MADRECSHASISESNRVLACSLLPDLGGLGIESLGARVLSIRKEIVP
jgi:hypothetical protein